MIGTLIQCRALDPTIINDNILSYYNRYLSLTILKRVCLF